MSPDAGLEHRHEFLEPFASVEIAHAGYGAVAKTDAEQYGYNIYGIDKAGCGKIHRRVLSEHDGVAHALKGHADLRQRNRKTQYRERLVFRGVFRIHDTKIIKIRFEARHSTRIRRVSVSILRKYQKKFAVFSKLRNFALLHLNPKHYGSRKKISQHNKS